MYTHTSSKGAEPFCVALPFFPPTNTFYCLRPAETFPRINICELSKPNLLSYLVGQLKIHLSARLFPPQATVTISTIKLACFFTAGMISGPQRVSFFFLKMFKSFIVSSRQHSSSTFLYTQLPLQKMNVYKIKCFTVFKSLVLTALQLKELVCCSLFS